MREIKFRAWDKNYPSEMIYLDLSGFLDPPQEFEGGLDGYEIMQYTGLHDKNGKEIYEGDIVELDGCIDGDMAEVMWLHPVAGFVFATKDGKDWWCPNSDAVSRSYEVIGNIYENPELLEKPNE